MEESFTNFEKGINWRSYVVCDVAYNNVNNWLWTPFIERGEANRIYIEIKFSMRDCNLFPGTALSCKETFSLLYYEFDAATREPPPWEPESYKLIDRIAADEGRFTSASEVIPPFRLSLSRSLTLSLSLSRLVALSLISRSPDRCLLPFLSAAFITFIILPLLSGRSLGFRAPDVTSVGAFPPSIGKRPRDTSSRPFIETLKSRKIPNVCILGSRTVNVKGAFYSS